MANRLGLSLGSSNCVLWHLENPLACVSARPEIPKFSQVKSPAELSLDERPILFLHGVEYDGPHEVLRDFVQPFLQSLFQDSATTRQPAIYFISWNSKLLSENESRRLNAQTSRGRLFAVLRRLPWWHLYFKDVGRRASQAAAELTPFIERWMELRSTGPTVISHSLGAKVWVDTLHHISKSAPSRIRAGIWWNLQPALSHRAFAPGGEYEMIPGLYKASEHARTVLWYSRLDFILSTLFLVATGDMALGQFGCRGETIPQRDVTRWVGEAHGMNHIRGRLGCFFRRTRHLIPVEAKALGIL